MYELPHEGFHKPFQRMWGYLVQNMRKSLRWFLCFCCQWSRVVLVYWKRQKKIKNRLINIYFDFYPPKQVHRSLNYQGNSGLMKKKMIVDIFLKTFHRKNLIIIFKFVLVKRPSEDAPKDRKESSSSGILAFVFFSSQLTFTCIKLTIETLEKGVEYVQSKVWRHWRCSGVVIVNFELISLLFLVFLLLTLNKSMLVG